MEGTLDRLLVHLPINNLPLSSQHHLSNSTHPSHGSQELVREVSQRERLWKSKCLILVLEMESFRGCHGSLNS